MNAPDTNLGMQAAGDISMSPRTRMPQAGCGSATVIAAQRDAAGDCAGRGNATARGLADCLCLAATPTFAIMALLTAVLGGGPADMLCLGMQDASPLTGMVPMYLLMSAFHAAPWLKLLASRRRGACRA